MTELPLGGYEFGGTIWLRANAARNWDLIYPIINHEGRHRAIAVSTPFGFVQTLMGVVQPAPWSSRIPLLDNIQMKLMDVSRAAYEAIATYAPFEPDAEDPTRFMPPLYREGRELFTRFFEHRDFSTTARRRMSLAIGARAFQTAILTDWSNPDFPLNDAFESYLEDPANQPNHLLLRILQELQSETDETVARWAGHLTSADRGLRLEPPAPSQLAGLEFEALSSQSEALRCASIIRDRVASDSSDLPDEHLERELELAMSFQVAIGYESLAFLMGPLDEPGWLNEVDLVKLDINPFDDPIAFDETLTIPPLHTLVHSFRPDYSLPHSTVLRTMHVPGFLKHAARRDATILVPSGLGLIPPKGSFGESDRVPLLGWLGLPRLTIGCVGPWRTLIETLVMLTYNQQTRRLVYTAIEPGAEAPWFYVLIRCEDDENLMIVHPTLTDVWEENRASLEDAYEFEFRPGGGFFSTPQLVADFCRFARVFSGSAVRLSAWADLVKSSETELRDVSNVRQPKRRMIQEEATGPYT